MNRSQRYRCSFLVWLVASCCTSAGSAQVLRTFTEPYERIDVSAAELGIVDSVEVRTGERVRRGQLLGRLNNGVLLESYRLAESRAKSTARLDAARADLKLKESMYQKLASLLQTGHANPAELERSKTEYEQAEAAFRLAGDEAAEAKIELARIAAQIRQREIRSPIDGLVIDLHRKPGEYLPANDPRFATVVDVSKLRSRFFIATDFAEQLRSGQVVELLIGTAKQRSSATIEFVSPITESESGTVRLDVLLENSTARWRSGVPCRLVVPESTLTSRRIDAETKPAGGRAAPAETITPIPETKHLP